VTPLALCLVADACAGTGPVAIAACASQAIVLTVLALAGLWISGRQLLRAWKIRSEFRAMNERLIRSLRESRGEYVILPDRTYPARLNHPDRSPR
jgi:hypothetical protein